MSISRNRLGGGTSLGVQLGSDWTQCCAVLLAGRVSIGQHLSPDEILIRDAVLRRKITLDPAVVLRQQVESRLSTAGSDRRTQNRNSANRIGVIGQLGKMKLCLVLWVFLNLTYSIAGGGTGISWLSSIYDPHGWTASSVQAQRLLSGQCRSNMKIYLNNLNNGTLWANIIESPPHNTRRAPIYKQHHDLNNLLTKHVTKLNIGCAIIDNRLSVHSINAHCLRVTGRLSAALSLVDNHVTKFDQPSFNETSKSRSDL
ncbi:hypothetical protein AAG570_011464 [Ranatra chinensis]|uniref:Uncharacterized protein n=1 Tax=Ranatra chinensis TaxID=642074 RepID=A0ABD0YKP4_9HEMI